MTKISLLLTALFASLITATNAMEESDKGYLYPLPIDSLYQSFVTSDYTPAIPPKESDSASTAPTPASMTGKFKREQEQLFNPSIYSQVADHYEGQFEEGDHLSVNRSGFVSLVRGGKQLLLKGHKYGQSGVTNEGLPDMKFCGVAYLAFSTAKGKPITLEYRDAKVFARDTDGKLLPEFFFLDPKPKECFFAEPQKVWEEAAEAFVKQYRKDNGLPVG